MSEIRKEMHDYIDILSDNKLAALKPLLSLLINDGDEPLIIETDLTDEEREIIAEGHKEYLAGNFVYLDEIE